MANERLLLVDLEERALYHGPSPEAGAYPLEKDHKAFIHPLIEQDLDSGSLAFGLVDGKGKVIPGKYFLPFKSTRRDELESALKDFEDSIIKGHGTISDRNRSELLGRIEFCINGAQVITPDSF